jgi:hypothetical protein
MVHEVLSRQRIDQVVFTPQVSIRDRDDLAVSGGSGGVQRLAEAIAASFENGCQRQQGGMARRPGVALHPRDCRSFAADRSSHPHFEVGPVVHVVDPGTRR